MAIHDKPKLFDSMWKLTFAFQKLELFKKCKEK